MRVKDTNNLPEIELALRVPYLGSEANGLLDALPELEAYLKGRYPGVDGVALRYRNPGPLPRSNPFYTCNGFGTSRDTLKA